MRNKAPTARPRTGRSLLFFISIGPSPVLPDPQRPAKGEVIGSDDERLSHHALAPAWERKRGGYYGGSGAQGQSGNAERPEDKEIAEDARKVRRGGPTTYAGTGAYCRGRGCTPAGEDTHTQ